MNESTRAYFYRIALAVLSVLGLYGVVNQDELPVYAEVAAAVLSVSSAGLAVKYTSTKPDHDA